MLTITDVSIDDEFAALLPEQDEDTRAEFEAAIEADGFRDPLVVWNGVLLDGHHRFNLYFDKYETDEEMEPPEVVTIQLASREQARAWVARNQLGRRNLPPAERIRLAKIAVEPAVKEQAKAKKKQSGGAVIQKSEKPPVSTTHEVAKTAGVSHDTVAKYNKVEAEGTPEQVQAMKSGEKSIHKAHQEVTAPKPAKQLEHIFEKQAEFASILAKIGHLHKAIKELANHEAGSRIELNLVDVEITSLKQAIRCAKPHADCPYCQGKPGDKTCKACLGKGWITHLTNKNLPKELKV